MRQASWAVLLALVGISLQGKPAQAADTSRKLNVLFIAIDDLNDWVSCLGGHPQATTPNIDRLAKRGVLFGRAYCAAPACNPSRAALLSGKRPTTTGIYHNNQPWRPVLKDTLTLPRHFKEAGYRVLAGGKIYHGAGMAANECDEYFNRPGDPRPKAASLSGLNRAQFDWGPLDAKDQDMGDYKLVDWAAKQLARKHDRPLFLAVGFVKPHLPWYAPKKYFDQFPLDRIQLPVVPENDLGGVPPAGVRMARPEGDHKAVIEAKQWKNAVQGYLACIAFLDAQVGRLLEALEKGPNRQDTLVVLWGDHGWHLGQKKHWRKFALWEEATRTTFIVAAPGVGKPGSRCDTPVDFMSVYPTLCELCGLTTPRHVEGKSLVPLLKDVKASWHVPALTTHGRGNHAVRLGQWRYIRYANGDEELYDHSTDPREWKNLARDEKHAGIKARLAKLLPQNEAQDAPRQRRGNGE